MYVVEYKIHIPIIRIIENVKTTDFSYFFIFLVWLILIGECHIGRISARTKVSVLSLTTILASEEQYN